MVTGITKLMEAEMISLARSSVYGNAGSTFTPSIHMKNMVRKLFPPWLGKGIEVIERSGRRDGREISEPSTPTP